MTRAEGPQNPGNQPTEQPPTNPTGEPNPETPPAAKLASSAAAVGTAVAAKPQRISIVDIVRRGDYVSKLPKLVDRVFHVREPRLTLDPFVVSARKATEAEYAPNDGNDATRIIPDEGKSSDVLKVTTRLNQTGLDDTTRLLLSIQNVYGHLLLKAIQEESIESSDTVGLYNFVVRNVEEPKRFFLATLLDNVLKYKNIDLSRPLAIRLLDLAIDRGLPLSITKVEPAVVGLLNTINQEGVLPLFVDEFVRRGEIDSEMVTPSIKAAMVENLRLMGVKFPDRLVSKNGEKSAMGGGVNGKYDEYFALAYHQALRQSKAADDPIDTARTKGSISAWDFKVDTFETSDDHEVIKKNILAAGALDFVFYSGEVLRIFDVTDVLVLRWAAGSLDVPDGPAAAALYRYYKLRSERATREERAMLYKRVLNKGDGELLSGMVVNEMFPMLWHKLMAEVAEYIRKSELNNPEDVSKARIYQAVKELQYNLTEHMTGMAHLQVTEMYAHLQEAIEILKSDDIVSSSVGRRKSSMWTVIEQIAKQEFGAALNVSLIRTLAVESNRTFQYIANFNQEADTEENFRNLLHAAEAWIVAQAMIDSNGEEMPEDEEEKQDDDFSDWED